MECHASPRCSIEADIGAILWFLSIFGDSMKRYRVYISYLDTPAGYHTV